MNLHELLGRKEEELQHLRRECQNLLHELHMVATGEVDPKRLHVNLEAGTWSRDPLLTDDPASK